MGRYDNIICEYPLPDEAVQDAVFQTRSMDRHTDNYVITKKGRLTLIRVKYEQVPEEERPYYGTNEWEDPIFRMVGSMRSVPEAEIDVHYHGILRFYTVRRDDGLDPLLVAPSDDPNIKETWYEYRAEFTEGKLVEIKRILGD